MSHKLTRTELDRREQFRREVAAAISESLIEREEDIFLRNFNQHWDRPLPPVFMTEKRFRIVGDSIVVYIGCYYFGTVHHPFPSVASYSILLDLAGFTQIFPTIKPSHNG